MVEPTRNIHHAATRIRQLDDAAINRIAAGEVVERPASAVKELVENALDAGASRIEVAYADGGKTLIRVTDDGHGIAADDLPLALSRHATSKIDGSDLLNIHSFGFRGEALPSLGAVGRLSLMSRAKGSSEAAEIRVAGGQLDPVRPAALPRGTVVTLRDLFHATPARLKFLRSDRAEAQAIGDVVRRLAMAEPHVGFTLTDVSGGGEGRSLLRLDPAQGELFDVLATRLTRLLGRDFSANALRIDAEREGLRLTGFAALPTYSRGSAVTQYLFVNGRPVRDRLLLGALRVAYRDFLSRDRHPAAVLNVICDPQRVDVNVHPAKAEVRFRDPGLARGLIVSGLRHALAEAGHRASTTVAGSALGAMRPEGAAPAARIYQMDRAGFGAAHPARTWQAPDRAGLPAAGSAPGLAPDLAAAELAPTDAPGFAETAAPSARAEETAPDPQAQALPLGAARAQLHENYIVAQTETGMVIVDQHAAHERLVYERLKRQMQQNGVASQTLLIPEIVELSEDDVGRLLDFAPELARFGLVCDAFGGGAIAVRETPAILGQVDAAGLIRDIADELADLGDSGSLAARLEAILSRVACHGSIRSGRRMRAEEMNALLREMEATPHSGQCNHGRPTYVELRLADIERLFGRA
ncbi:DNA mismatch repair endonuclease MutL [Brevirhabdus sp.]|uniref:DNA mismatch repair endonuclease MutL n=1 Tax=Brevirhabdus sp. TaxID=2004514 RepID=UPI004057EAB3